MYGYTHLLTVMLAWDLTSFLNNAKTQLTTWGGGTIGLIGVVMVIVGVVQIASALISHGKKQVSWPVAIGLVFIGGAFIGGGWNLVFNIAKGGQKTLEDLGGPGATILFFLGH